MEDKVRVIYENDQTRMAHGQQSYGLRKGLEQTLYEQYQQTQKTGFAGTFEVDGKWFFVKVSMKQLSEVFVILFHDFVEGSKEHVLAVYAEKMKQR